MQPIHQEQVTLDIYKIMISNPVIINRILSQYDIDQDNSNVNKYAYIADEAIKASHAIMDAMIREIEQSY